MTLAPKKEEGQFRVFHSPGRTVLKNIPFPLCQVCANCHLLTSYYLPNPKLLNDAYALVH